MVIFMIIGASPSQTLAANIAHQMDDVFRPLEICQLLAEYVTTAIYQDLEYEWEGGRI